MLTTRRTILTGLGATALGTTTLGTTALAAPPATASPAAAASAPTVPSPSAAGSGSRRRRPLVIGHRGTAGYRPEHTLASYELAARMGADFMEPDLVVTRDGVLVCRHEPAISTTTDVALHPEFADRRVTKVLDGISLTDWFTEDFTLAELKTLRAVERLPAIRQRNTMFDRRFEVPTFAEVLDLRRRLSAELGRELGVYPETKHPTYFQNAGLPLEQRLLDALRRAGLNHADAPVFVQSFEVTNLRRLRRAGLRTAAVQLFSATGSPYDTIAAGTGPTYADLASPSGLAGVARYAQGIGPDKIMIIPRAADGTLGTPTSLVADAHAVGLVLHPYTFRAENNFLPVDYRVGAAVTDYGRGIDEIKTYLRAGIDGFFTDQSDVGVLARAEVLAGV